MPYRIQADTILWTRVIPTGTFMEWACGEWSGGRFYWRRSSRLR